MSLFFATRKETQVGVDFRSAGVAVVQVKTSKNVAGEILRNEFLPSRGQEEQQLALQSWVSQHNLQKSPCICLMGSDDCDVNQIEKPNVDDSELLQALIWKIKDLVSYNVEEAVVDIYPMPVSSKNNTQQVSVVSAQESTVAAYVESINSTGLSLKAIDIHGLVRQNLSSVQQSNGKTQAILSIDENTGELSIFHDTDLYVSRGFKIGTTQLQQVTSEDQSIYDSLLLEIQRSMDYFESYFGLGSVGLMEIFPQTPVTNKMALYLQNLTSFDIDFVATVLDGDETSVLEAPCFHAYCAALRGLAA